MQRKNPKKAATKKLRASVFIEMTLTRNFIFSNVLPENLVPVRNANIAKKIQTDNGGRSSATNILGDFNRVPLVGRLLSEAVAGL
jgi:hypothetical protein